MKTGVIIQYHDERGLGVIFFPSALGERYFFYKNRIIGGGQPKVGAKVVFTVSSRPVRPGHMQYAQNITVLDEIENSFEQLTKLSESFKDMLAGGGQQ